MTKQYSNQKRHDYRIDSKFPFWHRKFHRASDTQSDKWQQSVTLNLSAGGAAITMGSEHLVPEDLLEFELIIPGGPVFGIAKVVRILDYESSPKAVGINFISVASKDRDKIARVVLSNGLERRHGKVK